MIGHPCGRLQPAQEELVGSWAHAMLVSGTGIVTNSWRFGDEIRADHDAVAPESRRETASRMSTPIANRTVARHRGPGPDCGILSRLAPPSRVRHSRRPCGYCCAAATLAQAGNPAPTAPCGATATCPAGRHRAAGSRQDFLLAGELAQAGLPGHGPGLSDARDSSPRGTARPPSRRASATTASSRSTSNARSSGGDDLKPRVRWVGAGAGATPHAQHRPRRTRRRGAHPRHGPRPAHAADEGDRRPVREPILLDHPERPRRRQARASAS